MRRLTKRGLAAVITAGLILTSGGAAQADPSGAAGDDPSIMIIGGTDATKLNGEVSLQLGGRHFCTGNLITHQWVLTAAHCTVAFELGTVTVRTGSLDSTTGGQLVGVERVEVNPAYTGEVVRGDHALIKLDQRVKARPIPMALSPGRPGTQGRIAGWGITCQDDRPECNAAAVKLQQLATVVADPKSCDLGRAPSGALIFDPKTEVCILSADGQQRMACFGDSGGPLQRKIGGKWHLVATTSGDGDDMAPRPNDCTTNPDGGPGAGIWAKTGPFFDWIISTLIGCGDRAAARELESTATRQ